MKRQGWVLAGALILPSVLTWVYFVVLAEPSAQSNALAGIHGGPRATQVAIAPTVARTRTRIVAARACGSRRTSAFHPA